MIRSIFTENVTHCCGEKQEKAGRSSINNRGSNRIHQGVAPASTLTRVQETKSLSPSPRTPSPRSLLTHPLISPRSSDLQNDVKELITGECCCNSPVADVKSKISGSNVVLRTVSRKIPGQIVKIINVLEKLCFEVLHLNICTMDDTVLYSFVIKIGLQCELSVEELAAEVQKCFSSDAKDTVKKHSSSYIMKAK